MSLVRWVCRCGRFLVLITDLNKIYTCEGCNKPEDLCHCKPIIIRETIER